MKRRAEVFKLPASSAVPVSATAFRMPSASFDAGASASMSENSVGLVQRERAHPFRLLYMFSPCI